MMYVAGGALFFVALMFLYVTWLKRDGRTTKLTALDVKEKETAEKLARAQVITSNAKADYDKAMADLPPDYTPPKPRAP